jgi:hypothetical protein
VSTIPLEELVGAAEHQITAEGTAYEAHEDVLRLRGGDGGLISGPLLACACCCCTVVSSFLVDWSMQNPLDLISLVRVFRCKPRGDRGREPMQAVNEELVEVFMKYNKGIAK